jgi:hypothetical protein
MSIIKLWKNKGQILEGIINSVFKKEDVEVVAKERFLICSTNKCGSFITSGPGCLVPGTHPCCSELTGGCGCSLEFKTRSLSSSCPKNMWEAVLTDEEENQLNEKLGI